MKISIITVSYNSANTIRETLESVKRQEYKDFEHILIDGNSNDNTLKICNEFSHISKIISEPDKGIYEAFNKGINYSSGDLIGFLNSDDIFFNSKCLNIIAQAFSEKTDCIFGDLEFINAKNKVKRFWKGSNFKVNSFCKGWMPAHPTFYCRKKTYEKYGLYNDSFKIAGDFELMLRFFEKHNIKSKYIPKRLIKMKLGLSNNSFKSKLDILKEEFKAFKINDISINNLITFITKLKKLRI